MKRLLLVAALALLAACANVTPETPSTGAAEGVPAGNARFKAAFDAGNAAGVADVYTPDAVLMPPGAAPEMSRASAQALWQGFIDAGATDLQLVTLAIEDHGGTATERGRYVVTVPDAKKKNKTHTIEGNYVVMWRRGSDDLWRIEWDIWNESPVRKVGVGLNG